MKILALSLAVVGLIARAGGAAPASLESRRANGAQSFEAAIQQGSFPETPVVVAANIPIAGPESGDIVALSSREMPHLVAVSTALRRYNRAMYQRDSSLFGCLGPDGQLRLMEDLYGVTSSLLGCSQVYRLSSSWSISAHDVRLLTKIDLLEFSWVKNARYAAGGFWNPGKEFSVVAADDYARSRTGYVDYTDKIDANYHDAAAQKSLRRNIDFWMKVAAPAIDLLAPQVEEKDIAGTYAGVDLNSGSWLEGGFLLTLKADHTGTIQRPKLPPAAVKWSFEDADRALRVELGTGVLLVGLSGVPVGALQTDGVRTVYGNKDFVLRKQPRMAALSIGQIEEAQIPGEYSGHAAGKTTDGFRLTLNGDHTGTIEWANRTSAKVDWFLDADHSLSVTDKDTGAVLLVGLWQVSAEQWKTTEINAEIGADVFEVKKVR